jgi:23S rRNA (cytidine1920-2'-O)/16S rRNA (cytidine1409-2'-O)-methyltransferase
VYAVDVGYGQLAWELRTDARVTVMERTNVRTLRPADLDEVVELVVADLSFISLGLVLAPLAGLDPDRLVMLVKPQFEAGRGAVGSGGVVRDTSTWRRVLGEVLEAAATLGLVADGLMASPLRGPAGNVEFLLAHRRGHADLPGGPPVDAAAVDAAIAEGEVLRG